MQLMDLFASSLVAQREEPALDVHAHGAWVTVTFGEIDAQSNRVARALEGLGFVAGDRLCLHLPNGIAFVHVVLACVRLGVVLVPLNTLYREREIAHIVGDAEPRAVITRRDDEHLFQGVRTVAIEALQEAAQGAADGPVRRPLEGTAPAAIVYTSGTTGRSRGAVLSHDNLLSNTVNLVACWRLTAADRYLAVLPLFHVHGLVNGLMTWLASGARMRLTERFDAASAARWFDEFAPTLFFGVPTVYVRLLDLDDEAARRIGSAMRLFVSGSAPLPAHVFEAFRRKYGHAILERYGMTETLMNMSNPYAGERRPGTVGLPLPGVAVRIVGDDGSDAGEGEVGEVLVRGPNVFQGYWRQPDATAAAFADGWFRTGDLADRSADGYYTLRGRRSDLIISGGFNIYPREVEDVLVEAPGVREAAVVGVPDAARGELPVAYIVADGGLETTAVEAHCRRMLASFKVPRAFIRVDALPRTALGKVQKHLLPPWRVDADACS